VDHTGGSSQPVQHPPAGGAAALRRAWREGIAALGPDAELPGLRALLDSRLTSLEQSGALDEPSLLGVAEEAAQLALETGSADLARSLSKRLRRAIYEFLLALDAAPLAASPATPMAPLEPSRPSRWGQVLIGVEEVEAAQRAGGDPTPLIDLDRVLGADDAVTAEVARAVARSEEGERDDSWTQAEAGRLLEIADAATEEVSALRELLEEAMAEGKDGGNASAPPAAYAAAAAAAQAYAAVVADAAAAEAEARAVADAAAEAEAARARAADEQCVEALLCEVEDAEDAAAHAMLMRLRLIEALPSPGALDPEAMRVPSMFRRDAPVAPVAGVSPAPVSLSQVPADAYLPPAPAAAYPSRAPAAAAAYPPAAAAAHLPPAPIGVEALPPPAPPSLFPLAPREGFHLVDPAMVEAAVSSSSAPVPAAAAPAPQAPSRWSLPPAPETPPLPAMHPPGPAAGAAAATSLELPVLPPVGPGSWSVRQSPRQQMLTERMAQRRREDAVRAAHEAAGIAAALAEPERKRRRGRPSAPERIADIATARDLVDEQLRRKRGAEAAALLQRVAAELPGRETADLALDSGDRCLALGQNRSATNCYLAGWRADPAYEAPLWRLADVCLTDREVALATGYLERIADLMRTRGDDAGALAVYRKIVTVAPEREDIRRMVRLAQAIGRLEV
jgi:hypothetical protein